MPKRRTKRTKKASPVTIFCALFTQFDIPSETHLAAMLAVVQAGDELLRADPCDASGRRCAVTIAAAAVAQVDPRTFSLHVYNGREHMLIERFAGILCIDEEMVLRMIDAWDRCTNHQKRLIFERLKAFGVAVREHLDVVAARAAAKARPLTLVPPSGSPATSPA